jgi:hypothetical protein
MPLRRLLLSLVLLFCIGPVMAASYQLSGRVTRADHVTPIPGTDVALYALGNFVYVLVARTTTDANGNYTLTADCNESCRLSAYLAPYFEEQRYLPATPGAVQMDFSLSHPAMITGQVSAGTALDFVSVQACRDITGKGEFTDCTDRPLDAQGQYTIDGLRPGNYRLCTLGQRSSLRMQCYDHQDAPAIQGMQQFEIVVLGDGETRNAIDFELNAGATISGHVRDALTNQPIGAEIEIYDENGELLGVYPNGSDYRSGGLAPGTYYVRASTTFDIQYAAPSATLYGAGACNTNCTITNGTPITLATGEAIGGIDIAITPRAIIRGTVRDAATQQPLAGLTVRQLRLIGIGIPAPLSTTTAADGSYRFYASPGQPFRVHADGATDYVSLLWPDRACPSNCDFTGTTLFAADGSDTIYDFSLARGGTITGAITAQSQDLAWLSLFSAASGARIWETTAGTDSGSYVSPVIAPGTYFLTAENFDACQTYSGYPCTFGNTQPFGTPITISAGQATTGIDFVLDADLIFRARFEN